MVSSKREMRDTGTYPEIRKKTRLKKFACWLLIDLTVAAVILALLLYKPSRYDPADFGSIDHEQGQVSPYLTHELLPKIHNDAQRGEPFELVITQKGINEIVGGWGWPKESERIMLYSPAVLFVPGSVVLMATANVKGVEFIITIVLEPRIDEQGLLSPQVAKVKIGAMNITPLAKMMAKKMYNERLATMRIDTESLQTKIAASLLNDEPFEPVFKVENRKVRIERITVHNGELTARLIPAS
jgi:uncharacterized protein YpmS